MTQFNKDEFNWDGMYLTYHGDQGELNRYYGENGEECHPTRVGMRKHAIIARFKYGRKPYKTWINFIVKNFTVEEYLKLSDETSPLQAMESKGFVEPHMRKKLKEAGLPATPEAVKQYWRAEAENYKKAQAAMARNKSW